MTESSAAHFSVSAGPTLESQPRKIRPLGEQIIIRVIPPLSVGSKGTLFTLLKRK
jgi:hypothetical protein